MMIKYFLFDLKKNSLIRSVYKVNFKIFDVTTCSEIITISNISRSKGNHKICSVDIV